MVLQSGKIYVPATATEIRDQLLADIELSAREQGIEDPPIYKGSELYIREDALSRSLMQCYAAQAQRDSARRILDADREELDEMRQERGLPEVNASTASGSIIVEVFGTLPVTIADGTQLLWPNGFRGKVNGAHQGVTNGAPVKVISLDTGAAANLPAGSKVTFVSAPTNVGEEATVAAADPVVGGFDAETDARLRARLINSTRNSPGGKNWADLIERALNASPAVQYAFVYPALGGPGSVKVVLMRAPVFDANALNESFSRVAPDSALIAVRGELFAYVGDSVKIEVQSGADINCDVAIQVDIPPSEGTGGDGSGWIDDEPWPELLGNDNGRVRITAITGLRSIRVSAETTVSPPLGNTIAWWSPHERRFRTATILAASGGPGAWELELSESLIDAVGFQVSTGHYICPAGVNTIAYGETWRQALKDHGPGENTTDENRLPVSLRKPIATESAGGQTWPMRLSHNDLDSWADQHSEIEDAIWSYRDPVEPTPPALVSGAPGVLVPRHFGVYKKAWFNQ